MTNRQLTGKYSSFVFFPLFFWFVVWLIYKLITRMQRFRLDFSWLIRFYLCQPINFNRYQFDLFFSSRKIYGYFTFKINETNSHGDTANRNDNWRDQHIWKMTWLTMIKTAMFALLLYILIELCWNILWISLPQIKQNLYSRTLYSNWRCTLQLACV